MNKNATILLTGGVSGGHATPTLSVFFTLKNDYTMLREFKNIEFCYFGREEGLERDVFERLVDKYYCIPASKLRSHFSWKNFSDIMQLPGAFSVALSGMLEVRRKAKKENSKVVLFSSGGYIALPVVLAAWLCGIPSVIHEQTSRAGLANRVTSIFAKKVLISFEASYTFFKKKKTFFTGYPFLKKTRMILSSSTKVPKSDETFSLRIPPKKKFLLVMGGSGGSQFINQLVKDQMSALESDYFIFHQVGRNNLSSFLTMRSDTYFPVGFVSGEEWITMLKKADVVVARSGAGTVSECVYLRKKVIFIPLKISRNDEQFFNAVEASKYIESRILREDEFSGEEGSGLLVDAISELQRKTGHSNDFKKKKAWEVFKRRTESAAITIADHVRSFVLEKSSKPYSSSNKNTRYTTYKGGLHSKSAEPSNMGRKKNYSTHHRGRHAATWEKPLNKK